MTNNILLTTSSFNYGLINLPDDVITKYNFIPNPHLRKMTKKEIINLIKEYQPVAIIAGTENIDEDVLNSANSIQIISRVGIGTDNIDLDAVKRAGVVLTTTKTSLSNSVAELVVGLIINVSRRISKQDSTLRKGKWEKNMGYLINGKTVGIIGYGKIGKTVHGLLKSFGCKFVIYDPYLNNSIPNDVKIVDSLDDVFQLSDIITIHSKYDDSQYHLINRKHFDICKESLILINTARGEIINTEDLVTALKSNNLYGAGIDVFETEPYIGPLTEMDNVVITPHIGSYAHEIRLQMEEEAIQNALNVLNSTN